MTQVPMCKSSTTLTFGRNGAIAEVEVLSRLLAGLGCAGSVADKATTGIEPV